MRWRAGVSRERRCGNATYFGIKGNGKGLKTMNGPEGRGTID